MPVHVGIDKAEDDGLVTHESLVVRLSIGDGLLIGTAVGHLPEDVTWIPLLVALFLDHLNPVVRQTHSKAVVEAHAAVFKLGCETRHARHLLSNGDGILVHLVDNFVGKGEIAEGVVVLTAVEIVAIAAEVNTQAVVVIEHGGDAVEAEAVEMEFVEPVLTVGQEEVYHLVLAIVEAEAVPLVVLTTVTRVEVLVRIATQVAESLDLILHSMRVNKVHDDSKAVLVSGIYKFLQVFRSTEAA